MFENIYFMSLFGLTPDRGASQGHTSHPEKGNISVELKFVKPLTEAIMCMLFLEFDNSVLNNLARNDTTDFCMDTVQILCTLRNVNFFFDVYASELLPRSITKICTAIVNADPLTE